MADCPFVIISTADNGEGSLCAAFSAAATATAHVQIGLLADGELQLHSCLVYEGTAPLIQLCTGQTIATSMDETMLTSANCADLFIQDLTSRGPGGFDVTARVDADGTAGKGIFIDLRDDQTGIANLSLTNVTVADVANNELHFSGCSLADYCGGGVGGGGAGEGNLTIVSCDIADSTEAQGVTLVQ